MFPATGERLLRFVGDKIIFTLRDEKNFPPKNLRAFLRTNPLAAPPPAARKSFPRTPDRRSSPTLRGATFRCKKTADGWQIELPLAEIGFFKAKAYLLDEKNWQHWPDGSDVGISVHPNFARTAKYKLLLRLHPAFGATKNLVSTAAEKIGRPNSNRLEAQGYATLPPSGKFRDLACQLPFIVTSSAAVSFICCPCIRRPRLTRASDVFGSPYAALDLTAVIPRSSSSTNVPRASNNLRTPYAAHSFGARVFIDIVINHTGWGSTLQEKSSGIFLKKSDGDEFASPGAWGTVWEDWSNSNSMT